MNIDSFSTFSQVEEKYANDINSEMLLIEKEKFFYKSLEKIFNYSCSIGVTENDIIAFIGQVWTDDFNSEMLSFLIECFNIYSLSGFKNFYDGYKSARLISK